MKKNKKCIFIRGMGGARCISVLSSFVRLKKEIGFLREDTEPQDTSKEGECVRYLASRCLLKYLTAKLKK